MSAVFKISITPPPDEIIRAANARPEALRRNLRLALERGLVGIENHAKRHFLRGGNPRSRRDGTLPLAVRSGTLLGAVTNELDQPPFSGFVGTAGGAASNYAHVILGAGAATIRPARSKHLWIPLADNLDPSGVPRMSPREAMGIILAGGKRALRIFKSKAGNLVAFLPHVQPGPQGMVRTGEKWKRNTKSGRKKGDVKGRLLFVLKQSVTVQGTDALALAAQAQGPQIAAALTAAVHAAGRGQAGPGGEA